MILFYLLKNTCNLPAQNCYKMKKKTGELKTLLVIVYRNDFEGTRLIKIQTNRVALRDR